MTRTLRIALVDDQDLVRSGFRMILDAQKDMCVVGQASDGVGVLPMVKATQPDIVLMDIRMPTLDGISATHAVLGSHPDLKVLILTTFDLTTTSWRRCGPGPRASCSRTRRRPSSWPVSAPWPEETRWWRRRPRAGC